MPIIGIVLAMCWTVISMAVYGQRARGPEHGVLILTGGDFVKEAIDQFTTLAGGKDAFVVYIPTAASEIKLPSGYIFNPDSVHKTAEFRQELTKLFGMPNIIVLHTRNRVEADDEKFISPIKKAGGVWIGAGNAGRLADTYLGTKTERELKALLERGKVIGGNSAGAIIQGSFIVRGRPDKPLLMPKDHTTGFGFLKDVAINPHVISAKRENELVEVLDAHPHLLGIGMDDNTAIKIQDQVAEIITGERIAIYENIRRDNKWYYWIKSPDRFNLLTHEVIRR